MKQLLPKLTNTILTYAQKALLDIICLHGMGMTSVELSHFLPAPYPADYEARCAANLTHVKDLDIVTLSPKLNH